VDLFDSALASEPGAAPSWRSPLAVRMRPGRLDEVFGQDHLLASGSALRRLMAAPDAESPSRAAPASLILWGPPGSGKTTVAYLIAGSSGRAFVELSAVSAGVKDIRAVIDEAKRRLATSGQETVLFIDEVHRFSKAQQDALLPSVENRLVTLVAATTENPSFSIITPLASRSILLTLRPLDEESIGRLVDRAIEDPRGLAGSITLAPPARANLVRLAGGDARRALMVLEAAAGAALEASSASGSGAEAEPGRRLEAASTAEPASKAGPDIGAGRSTQGPALVDAALVEQAVDVALVRYDRAGDQHYDVISAFIKSIRGSDVDAALHYLARMIQAGEDPRFIARRLIILASEDVGMADPSALQTAVAAAQAVQMIGLPEGRIVLAQAVVHLATAPKSNASYTAIDAALADVRACLAGPVPPHLRGSNYAGAERLGHGQGYIYAHDEPHAVATQRYAPDDVQDKVYYRPTDRGFERHVADRLAKIRAILGAPHPPNRESEA